VRACSQRAETEEIKIMKPTAIGSMDPVTRQGASAQPHARVTRRSRDAYQRATPRIWCRRVMPAAMPNSPMRALDGQAMR
jgi:hypothetical protein